MAAQEKRITDLTIRGWAKLRPDSAKSCGDNLYFRAHESGVNQWYFRYTLHGKARWMFLGNYPDKSLEMARKDARRARIGIDDGKDVSVVRLREKLSARNAKTVGELANDWYREKVERSIENPQVVRRVLDNHVLPKIGNVLLTDVRPTDIERVLKAVRHKYPSTANSALRHMRKIFRHGAKLELMTHDPAVPFDLTDAGGVQKSRKRALKLGELVALFKKMRDARAFGRENELATKLLLALCVRKMELLAAAWREFDLDKSVWTLPAERTKTRQSIAIPLSVKVVAWLRELKVFAGRSEYVFPARRITKQRRFDHVSPDTLNWALKNLDCGLEHFTVHDMRRAARTHLSELKVSSHIAERALNHKLKGVEGVYDMYEYFEERKEALDRWAGRLAELEAVCS